MQDKIEDSTIVKACLNGQKEQFELLVEKYMPQIFGYLRKKVRDLYAVEDIAQESFFLAFTLLNKCTRPEGFRSWLFEITRNCLNKWIEKHHHRYAPILLAEPFSDEEIPSTRDYNQQQQEDLTLLLANSLGVLSDNAKTILHLKYHEKLSCKQISEKLGKPLGSVTRILCESYAKLENILTTFLEEEK